MNYAEYVKLQSDKNLIKPVHYHLGEWKAMNNLCYELDKDSYILDVGCGIGYGIGMFNKLGFFDVIGVDINPKKIVIGKNLGYSVENMDVLGFPYKDIDAVWLSHSFEHMRNPEDVLIKLLNITSRKAKFFFVLPYPDLDPAPAHCSSKEIGLSIDDGANTVINWFENRGLRNTFISFDDFREPEIWMEFIKK